MPQNEGFSWLSKISSSVLRGYSAPQKFPCCTSTCLISALNPSPQATQYLINGSMILAVMCCPVNVSTKNYPKSADKAKQLKFQGFSLISRPS